MPARVRILLGPVGLLVGELLGLLLELELEPALVLLPFDELLLVL